jgi:hypothetical protein
MKQYIANHAENVAPYNCTNILLKIVIKGKRCFYFFNTYKQTEKRNKSFIKQTMELLF